MLPEYHLEVGRLLEHVVRVPVMSVIFMSPAYLYGVGAQYICDQIGWESGFRRCYTTDDIFFG